MPEINTHLSSDSPVGIWMLSIDATSKVTLYDENNTDITSIEKADHQIREFITISPASTEGYIIQECSIYRAPNIIISNVFFRSPGFALKANTLSLFFEVPSDQIETIESIQHLAGLPLSHQTSLILDRNLSLKGSASQLFKSRPINTNDPLVPAYKSYDQTNILDIKGVKISDETNFSLANELTTNFTINGVPFLDTEETAMKCLRIENKNTTINRYSSDIPEEISYTSETFISADFNSTNRISLQIDEPSTPERTRLQVFSDYSLFTNPQLPIHFPYCENDNSGCQEIIKIKLKSYENMPNKIGGDITASNVNSKDINIEISVSIK